MKNGSGKRLKCVRVRKLTWDGIVNCCADIDALELKREAEEVERKCT